MMQTTWPGSGRTLRAVAGLLLFAALAFGAVHPAEAQQKDKKKKDAPAANTSPTAMMTDEQQVDFVISTMLGAWQVGDVNKLREVYADDVIVVSGVWGPPVIGWANYAPLYQQSRARMTQVRMDRSNTYSKVAGTFAWACYQWDFSATIDGVLSGSRGQTTLVLEKRGGKWLIVHNHTAQLEARTVGPAGPGNGPPAMQPPADKPASR
jgi:ketosteroid isomerase-like protein